MNLKITFNKRKCGVMMKKLYRKYFLGFELILSIVLTLITICVIRHYYSIPLLVESLDGIRNSLYGALASLAGALLGFVITGLSVLLMSNSAEGIEKLKRSKHYSTIFYIFFSTSKYLSILLLVSLISLVLDKDSSPVVTLFFLTFWAFLIVVFRLLRCLWVLEKMVDLHTRNS